jgi:hypothetical protein
MIEKSILDSALALIPAICAFAFATTVLIVISI